MATATKNVQAVFTDALNEIAKHKDQQKAIEEFLIENHNMTRGSFLQIVSIPSKIETQNEIEKLVFLNAIYVITQNPELQKHLEGKTKKIEAYKFKQAETLKLPIQYNKVLSGLNTEKEYVTPLSYQDIVKHVADEIWTYNYLTQRNPIKKMNKKGEVKLSPKVNRKNVNEIKMMIKNGDFKPDAPITINVLSDGNESISYDDEDWTLLIETVTEQDIIDGWHRIVALQELLEEDPSIEGYLFVTFRIYDIDEAQTYLGQINSFSTFSKAHTRKLKSMHPSDKVVKRVEDKSILRGRVAGETAVKQRFNEITNFAVLSEAIAMSFELDNKKDIIDVSNYLIDFVDYFIGSYENEFVKDVREVSKTSYINHHNLFIGYFTVASWMQKNNVPLNKIKEIIDGINFDKKDGDLSEIMGGQGKTNSNKVKKQIKEYFDSYLNSIKLS